MVHAWPKHAGTKRLRSDVLPAGSRAGSLVQWLKCVDTARPPVRSLLFNTALDDGRVLGRRDGVVGGGEDALGGAALAVARGLDVDLLGRHGWFGLVGWW